MLRFAIKNAFRKKGVAILSSMGIGFGLMLQFVLGAFSAGVTTQVNENFEKALGLVEITQFGKGVASSELPTTIVDQLYATNFSNDIQHLNVKLQLDNTFSFNYIGKIQNTGDNLVVIGVNRTMDEQFKGPTSKITDGSVFTEGSDNALIDSRLLAIEPNFSTSIGETLDLVISPVENYSLTISGVYQQDDNGAPSFVPRTYFVYIDIMTARKILGLAGFPNTTYTQIDIQFPAISNEMTSRYVGHIKSLSNEGYFGSTFVEAYSPGELQAGISDTLGVLTTFTSVISFITLIAGGMSIIVAQLNSVSARMKEFAILKSTGWTNSHIFKEIIYESLVLGVLGAFIGLGLGSILIVALSNSGGFFGPSTSVIVTPLLVFQVVAFALGIGILGGFYPGLKAARVRPVKVLKGE
jgi:putative ABC transport system permease protein